MINVYIAGTGEPAYCEECYQDLITQNASLQMELRMRPQPLMENPYAPKNPTYLEKNIPTHDDMYKITCAKPNMFEETPSDIQVKEMKEILKEQNKEV